VHATDQSGSTALLWAAEFGLDDLLSSLLQVSSLIP
jgi:ankyrin repeat protein